ncbi:helix-turn-helix domain-containing protein [Chitinimonas arctica]|uniref:Helix-turn-helix domain-containing protein n=1 Tax=Chitinimonas arctica TaxID=2594795 RepID=A0A516SFW2_9NEIS|nr:helix-turn-helix transcriptional regulator [Chitinimonas arctica]QDQ26980.1 helix-turn-helix domain-containing protein [Chitinimonas arctica]
MPRVHQVIFPAIARQLTELGERLRLARLRRNLTAVSFAERLDVSRDTLSRLENGDPSIAIGTYAKALRILGLDRDIDQIASDDVLGRKLQDLALPPRKKAASGTRRNAATGEFSTAPIRHSQKASKHGEPTRSGFAATHPESVRDDGNKPVTSSQKNRAFLANLLQKKAGTGNGES